LYDGKQRAILREAEVEPMVDGEDVEGFGNSTQDPGKAWDLKPPMRSFASSLALLLKKSSLMHLSLEFTRNILWRKKN
jgi:hypothetical protein